MSPDPTAVSWSTTGVTHGRIVAGDIETWQASCTLTDPMQIFWLKVTRP
ncbi:MAG: hypothetical protein U1F77_11390 [Kiritimatiellia bacterium]